MRSAGRRLDAQTAETLGTQLGWDLTDVRVHTDRRAAASAAAIDARAYTVGADIAFAAEEYAPDTARGRHLLVHELAHVAQDTTSTGAVGAPAVVHRTPRDEAASQRRAPTQRERAFAELVLNYAMETGNDQLLRRLGVAEDVIETAREGKGILGRWGQMRRRGRPQSRPGGRVSLGVDALLGAGEVAIEIARARERRGRDQAYVDLVEGAIKLGVEVYPVAVRNAPAVFIIHPEQERQTRIEARERFAGSLREEISRLSGGNREAFQSFLEFPVEAEISDLRAGRDVEPNVLRRDPQVLYRFLPVPSGRAEHLLEAQQD